MRLLLLALLSFSLAACDTSGVFLEQSRPVPDVSAPNQDGKIVNVRDACSGPWSLVFFYPEADTPG
ncbi:MAG: redoxin domain-containing protein [Akkermansiaceae bacterium]|nr:redoxin domain-containing protein [Akkermansiaceae bacterium]